MKSIMLTAEQSRELLEASGEVQLLGPDGALIAHATAVVTDVDVQIALARLRAGGPTHTTQEVLERLERLKPHLPDRPLSPSEAKEFMAKAKANGWF